MEEKDQNQQGQVDAREKTREAVEAALEQVRPYLVRDGGGCDLVDVSPDGKVVYVRLQGACSFCPSAIYTLKLGIEQVIKERVPGVERVEAVQ